MHKCVHKLGADILSKIVIAGFIGFSLLTLISCESRKAGPAEQAGKEVDKAASAVGNQVKKTGESIQKATRQDSP